MHRTTILAIIHIWMALSMLQSSSNGKIEAEKGGWETSRGEQIAWVRGALRSKGKRRGWEVALVRSLVMYGLWEVQYYSARLAESRSKRPFR